MKMAFRGSAPAKIDDRGRLKIPAAFRGFFETAPLVFITCLAGPAVLIYPMETYEREVEGNLDSRAGLNLEPTSVLRRLNANGMAAQVDGQGRITIAQDLRDRVELVPGKTVRVIGMKTYLEIWDEVTYREMEAKETEKEIRHGV